MSLRPLAPLTLAALAACAQPPEEGPRAIRLVDRFGDATIEATAAPPADAEPSAGVGWRFDGDLDDATGGWRAGGAVEDLAVRDGRLVGRVTGDLPVIYVERTSGPDDADLLYAVEIDLKASGGDQISIDVSGDKEAPIEQVLGRARAFPWATRVPLAPGDEVRRVTLRPARDVAASDVHHVLLRPTDAEGAEFEIESVRLVFRRQHIAAAGAGIGWHGMSNVYREAIATRAFEAARFSLELPARAWLDLAVASIDPVPVSFRVTVAGAGGDERTVLERTVTTPHRWEEAAVDLADFAGRQVRLTLDVDAEDPGAVGFWGSPVVRRRLDAPAAADGAARPRGVVVIVGDTLRRDHLDAWGYGRVTAPTLAAMAEGGVRAADCISQATWTKVSVPSIFTSLYPLTHGVRDFPDRLPASAETMAELFRDAGYATLGLSSIPFTGRMTNLHQGYEEFHESASLPADGNAKTARVYVDRLTAWLERHRDAPFFVFLHVADPHSPYLPYAPYDTLWGAPGDREEYQRQQDRSREHIQNSLMRRFGMPGRQELIAAGLDPEAYVGYEHDAYDGSIRAMDVEIARLLERLRQLGLEEHTLIAFISDHGTEFLDHDGHFHGHSVYGELARVPLLLDGPGVPAGRVIEPTVESLDLMPTVLELAGLETPAEVQGQSLVPLFDAGAGAAGGDARFRPRPAFTEKAPIDGTTEDLVRGPIESYAIVADGWKLIHNPQASGGAPELELYNTAEDPLDQRDLAAEHPGLVDDLREQLTAWRERAEAARLTPDSALVESMSAEDLKRLRSLGYVQ